MVMKQNVEFMYHLQSKPTSRKLSMQPNKSGYSRLDFLATEQSTIYEHH